ncbi:MAG: SUF system NifU family Fe-S cluster assembly protein [Calditrichia bacterium]
MEFDDLYQDMILDHYKNPRNFGKIENGTCELNHENPSCGDSITIYLKVEDGIVKDVKFSGRGCAISMASASMMTEMVMGQPIGKVLEFSNQIMAVLRGELDESEIEDLGELEALVGVKQFPMRVKCATLAWHTLNDALDQQKEQ